ncbi:hypothetical protein GC089_00760 [Cellulomonas sp. JZ18]|uniref:hypothetical protein n=1 Tax=Cellulomonas sp. JZ18 TaxID=2654191 RepID=UPI0012D3A9C3|nr:hypothetical protein [Cellulomonas sp. JZ18]QGQ18066.1 hypothetical protein GC089_00760 [Cellulomonas sp. JZ18]
MTDEHEDGPVDEQVDTQVQEHEGGQVPDGGTAVVADEGAQTVEEAFDRVRASLHAEEARLAAELERTEAEARAAVDAAVTAVKEDLATQAERVRAAIAEQRDAVVAEGERVSAELDAQAEADVPDGDVPLDPGRGEPVPGAHGDVERESAAGAGGDGPVGTEVGVEDGEVTRVQPEPGHDEVPDTAGGPGQDDVREEDRRS